MEFKRYMVIAFDDYYPAGGLGDCVDSFNDLGDALRSLNSGDLMRYDHAYLFDRVIGKNIYDRDELLTLERRLSVGITEGGSHDN